MFKKTTIKEDRLPKHLTNYSQEYQNSICSRYDLAATYILLFENRTHTQSESAKRHKLSNRINVDVSTFNPIYLITSLHTLEPWRTQEPSQLHCTQHGITVLPHHHKQHTHTKVYF